MAQALLTPIEPNSNDQAFSGMVFVNPLDNLFGRTPNAFPLYVNIKGFILTCGASDSIPSKRIAMNKQTRTFLKVSLSNELPVRLFEPTAVNRDIEEINVEVELAITAIDKVIEIDDAQLSARIVGAHNGKFMKNEQMLILEFNGLYLILNVASIKPKDSHDYRLGPKTVFKFETRSGQKIRMKSMKQKTADIFGTGFKMESLKVGGLDK